LNAHALAHRAYAPSSTPIRTARGAEYDAIARITRRLRAAGETGTDFAELAAALHANRALWTVLAADASDSANALPPSLRAQVVYLAEYTARHSSQVLRGETGVDALVDINTAILRGLRSDGSPT